MTLIHKYVEEAQRGENPRVILRVPSGWVTLGESQFLKGYCVLLSDPVVSTLNDLKGEALACFMRDWVFLGEAITKVTKALRINYEILGNVEPALHAHAFPRFSDEDPELKTKPVWFYQRKPADDFNLEKDSSLMSQIKAALIEIYQREQIPLPE